MSQSGSNRGGKGPAYFAPKEHVCKICSLRVTTRNGLKKHYITQYHMRLLHGDDDPIIIRSGELPGLLEKVRAGQRHRVASPVPSGGGTLLDTATGGRPVSPPPPPPAPQGVTKLNTVVPVELFAKAERDIYNPTRRLREEDIPPAARVRGTRYPRVSPRSS